MAHIDGYDRYMDQQLNKYLDEKPPYCTVCGAGLGGGYLAYEVDDELLCENCMDDYMNTFRMEHEVEV